MNLETYLKRIEIMPVPAKVGNSLELLTELQYRHLLSIPFENLDIPGQRIELDIKKIYDKIIPSKRGGFCYELNGMFHWLLTSLGFNVDMLSARVFNPENNQFGPEFDHMALKVRLDKNYLADVGFGDSLRVPVEIPDHEKSAGISEAEDFGGRYRVLKIENDLFDLQKLTGQVWLPQYRFSTVSRRFQDFKGMCDFQQDSPDSHFRNTRICTKATPNGRITLGNNSLTVTDGGLRKKTSVKSEEEFYILLNKYFGISSGKIKTN